MNVDPKFWERLRERLRSYMRARNITQREFAPKLGIDPTTLNNFLNGHSDTLGGLSVALACTLIDLVCDGTKIGRVKQDRRIEKPAASVEEQLVLEFDAAFEFKRQSKHPTLVLRKPAASNKSPRLFIRRIG
jgi:transcriptional regulator with XRE-family HTH domain